jgi:FG-GAP-like repeat
MKTRPSWRAALLLWFLFLLPVISPTFAHADILWRHAATGQNAVWCMDGVTLTSAALFTPLGDPNWTIVGVGDFNGDGKPDILWRHAATGQNAV